MDMKMNRNIIILAAAALLAAVSTGCSVNEVEENIFGSFPYLELETESMNLPKTASTGAVGFESNRTLSVDVLRVPWLKARVEGEQIVIEWEQNDLETTRDAEIVVSTPNSLVSKKIKVVQDASGELTFDGNLILRSKAEIASNSYTKTKGNLLLGDIVYGNTKADTEESVFDGRTLISHPSDITDEDIAKLNEQIHLIANGGLAVVNTQVATFPADLIRNNDVRNVCFDFNAMRSLPSSDVMQTLNVETLSLRCNGITDISSLPALPMLTILDLSENDIYDLKPLTSIQNLSRVVLSDLPLTAPLLEIFREQNKAFEIIADNIRVEDTMLPVFGDIEVKEISESQVEIKVKVLRNAEGISKAGFYIGKKRVLSEMTYHEASTSGGVLTLTYNPESLHNMIYHVRAYAVNGKGEGYSEASYFGSLTSENDIEIKSASDLDQLYEDNYSHVNASVLVGNYSSSSSSSAIRLNDGKYDLWFKSATDLSDLAKLKSIVYIRDGLYIGNVGLKDLNAVSHIKGIQTLWLRGNKISNIPDLACRETLTYLDVSMNSLTGFDFLAKLPKLETLYLGSSDAPEQETNDIGLLDGLEKYTNLKYIDLSGLPLHQWQVDDLKAKMPDTEIVFTSGGNDPWIPTVNTKRVTRKGDKVTLNGLLASKGKSDITEHGFYYGKDKNALEKVVAGDAVADGSTFSAVLNIYDLDTYYYYAYAKNSYGESRSDFMEFSLAYMDLSQAGTANCYIVQTPGQYKFDASVRGNSVESVGSPASAEIVWQFTDPEQANANLITSVNLNGNYVEFVVADNATYGNALIAVKDAAGTILWSWHIWICDFDPELSAHIYKGGNVVMDRNLGATTLNTGSYEERNRATGTLYEWGRKDPMTTGTITTTRYPFNTPEESYSEPTSFVTSDMRWAYAWDNYLWSADQKTMYDPCPPGWTVADRHTWDNLEMSERDQYSVYFKYDSKGNKAVYPIGFTIDSNFSYDADEWSSFIWTSEFDTGGGLPCNLLFDRGSTYYISTGQWATDAFPVRCKKDVGFTVSTGDFDVMSEYAVLSGNVKYNDATHVTDRGFVWSSDTSVPDLNNATVVACGAGEGDYSATVTGLKPGTTYYVRAYAIGGNVTKYSRAVSFTTEKGGSGDDFTEDDYEWE